MGARFERMEKGGQDPIFHLTFHIIFDSPLFLSTLPLSIYQGERPQKQQIPISESESTIKNDAQAHIGPIQNADSSSSMQPQQPEDQDRSSMVKINSAVSNEDLESISSNNNNNDNHNNKQNNNNNNSSSSQILSSEPDFVE